MKKFLRKISPALFLPLFLVGLSVVSIGCGEGDQDDQETNNTQDTGVICLDNTGCVGTGEAGTLPGDVGTVTGD